MKLTQINDDAQVVAILQRVMPEWIEDMPAVTAAPGPNAKIFSQACHSEAERRGLLAVYFGAGCAENDRGWFLWVVDDIGADEFNGNVVPQLEAHLKRKVFGY